MPNLIVGNVNNENMVGEPWRLSYEKKCFSSVVANRLTWLVENEDVLLLPYPLSDAFLQYVCSLIGVEKRSLTVLSPASLDQDTEILTFDVLRNPSLLEHLQYVLHDHSRWTITPYYFDRAIAWLSKQLHLPIPLVVRDYFLQGGAEQLNSKSAFRRIAAAHSIPVADGAICSSELELRIALQEYLAETGHVIVKQDLCAGGKGNVVLTRGQARDHAGAAETIQIAHEQDVTILAERLWDQMTGPRNNTLVVEVYYPDSIPYYSELDIPMDGRRPFLANFGEMRMDPIWVGFEIPCQSLSWYQLAEFTSVSMILASIAQTMGFVGKINCDAICTPDGRVLFTEVNGRLGGCTHIHVLASRLFGSDYGNHHTILTQNKIKTGPFEEVLHLLDQEGLLYTHDRGRGVIILTEDTNRTGTIEYMVVAPLFEEAQLMERYAQQVMERSLTHEDRYSCLG